MWIHPFQILLISRSSMITNYVLSSTEMTTLHQNQCFLSWNSASNSNALYLHNPLDIFVAHKNHIRWLYYMCDNIADNIDKISSQNAPRNVVNTKVSCFTFTINLCKYFEQLWGDVHASTESTHVCAYALKQNGQQIPKILVQNTKGKFMPLNMQYFFIVHEFHLKYFSVSPVFLTWRKLLS